MKKIYSILAVVGLIALFGVGTTFAQTDKGFSKPRSSGSIDQYMQIYPDVQCKVVSLGATIPTYVSLTSGRGIIVGVEMSSVSIGGAKNPQPWGVEIYDMNSLMSAPVNWTAFSKAAADQFCPEYSASNMIGIVNRDFQHPRRFEKGITIVPGASATNGTVTIYWVK